jgi:hypothetical protein
VRCGAVQRGRGGGVVWWCVRGKCGGAVAREF